MLIAHISDLHVFADHPESSLVRKDATEVAKLIINDISEHSPKIDAVMLTGDVADGGSLADYQAILPALVSLGVPIFAIPGNHDHRDSFRQAFKGIIPEPEGSFINYDMEFNGVRVVALDSVHEGHVEGRLAQETIEWLTTKLREPFSGVTYILVHHPPFRSGIAAWDDMALVEGRQGFNDAIQQVSSTTHVLCGHIHRPYQTTRLGITASIGGSPAFQIGVDLAPNAVDPGCVNEPYCYFVHAVEGTSASIHRRFVEL